MPDWIMGLGSWVLDNVEGLLAALGLALVAWELRLQTRAEKEGLTHAYLSRYWEIDDALRSPSLSPEDRTYHLTRYLRLTEDEFEAARLGWLPRHRWRVWHEWLCDDRFRDELTSRLDDISAPEDEYVHVKGCLGARSCHAWEECPSFSKSPSWWGRHVLRRS